MKNIRTARFLPVTLAVLGLASSMIFWAEDSSAVGTRHFVIETGSDFEKGELEGVAVDSTGFLRSGLDLGKIEVVDAESVWSSLEDEGRLLLGTGNEGKLFEVKAGKVKEIAGLEDALAITCLERAFGKILVGAIPGGKLYELKGGELKEFSELKDAEHIWAMSYDSSNKALYVATGPEGKLFRVTADGTAQVYYDSPQKHLMSVAVELPGATKKTSHQNPGAGGATVYAGSSGEARLYRITGPGRAQVMHDFSSTEVRAIEVGPRGSVFTIVNELNGGPRSDGISKLKPKSPSRPSAKSGKGKLYRFDQGKPEELYSSNSEHFVSLHLDKKGRPVVGTGTEGKVVRVEKNHNHAVVADVEERQVTSIAGTEKGGWVIANDPVVAHPIEGVGGTEAVWTSEVLDAGLRARFGRIGWDAEGKVEFSTRSGNTKEPNETWTDWSARLKKGGLVSSERGRYLQVRARLVGGEKARVRRISIPFVTDNLRPIITEVTAKSNALTSGSRGMSSSGGPVSPSSSSKIKLSWDVDNPDEDTLRYRVEYRKVPDTQWFDALPKGEVLTNKNWEWETSDLPEGRYRVRVSASDEPSNAPSKALTHRLVSEEILVDNTAPTLKGLSAAGRKLVGTVSDTIGPVRRVELRAAGEEEWIPLEPKDGIYDQSSEAFEMALDGIVPDVGALITVRVFDTAGNTHVEHVRVPAR